MTERNGLRSDLRAAWRHACDSYEKRQVNSEAGLLVHFCIGLAHRFKDKKRQIFVQPHLKLAEGVGRYPDVLVCNRDRIVAVVELKFKPRGKPTIKEYEKDLGTLALFCQTNEDIAFESERYRGPLAGKAFTLAGDAVLCWGGITSGGAPSTAQVPTVLRDRLFTLPDLDRAGT